MLALIDTSTIDHAAIAERVGQGKYIHLSCLHCYQIANKCHTLGQTKNSIYHRLYAFKCGRSKSFNAVAGTSEATEAAPAADKPKSKKRKLANVSTADGDAGVKEQTD